MPRYRLIIEFDGTAYAGWQRQNNGPSVQGALETAVTAFCSETATVHGAGRTDAGVHALAMTAHVDLARAFRPDTVRDAINFHLKPQPIAVIGAFPASPAFHARFDCLARHYRYVIINRRPPLTFERNFAWRVGRPLDVRAMHAAAQRLVGQHDFTTFRAAQCQAHSPVKTMAGIAVDRRSERVLIRCHARSFLHHQVRSIAGSLVRVGQGDWTADDLAAALAARDRAACGPVAPPDGLYFVRADYPPALSAEDPGERSDDLGNDEQGDGQGEHDPDNHTPVDPR